MPMYFIAPIVTQWCIRLVTRAWWRVFGDLKVRGEEHLQDITSPIIFAANHLSDWDGPLIRSALPMFSRLAPIFYVSLPKKYYQGKERGIVRRILWGGKKFRLIGAYPAYLGVNDLKISLKHHVEILKDKGTVCIFPEGKRSPDGVSIGQFKTGVAYLAYTSGCPVIPLHVNSTQRAQKEVSATITFGAPVRYRTSPNLPADEELHAFSDMLRKKVTSLN